MVSPAATRWRLSLCRRVLIVLTFFLIMCSQVVLHLTAEWTRTYLTAISIDGQNYPVLISLNTRGYFIQSVFWVDVELKVMNKNVAIFPPVEGAPYPWIADSFDPPFHVMFERVDGTITQPLEVKWHAAHESSDYNFIEWSTDGRKVLHIWCDQYRFSPLRTGRQIVFGGMVQSILVTIVATILLSWPFWLVIRSLAKESRWIHLESYQCYDCGYNLRGTESDKCPECGWKRDQ